MRMNAEQLFAQITKVRFWIVVGALVLIAFHPEWIFGMFREDLTALDIALGIVEGGIALAGFCVLLFGFPVRDWLVRGVGLAMAGGGAFLLWLTFG